MAHKQTCVIFNCHFGLGGISVSGLAPETKVILYTFSIFFAEIFFFKNLKKKVFSLFAKFAFYLHSFASRSSKSLYFVPKRSK